MNKQNKTEFIFNEVTMIDHWTQKSVSEFKNLLSDAIKKYAKLYKLINNLINQNNLLEGKHEGSKPKI